MADSFTLKRGAPGFDEALSGALGQMQLLDKIRGIVPEQVPGRRQLQTTQ